MLVIVMSLILIPIDYVVSLLQAFFNFLQLYIACQRQERREAQGINISLNNVSY